MSSESELLAPRDRSESIVATPVLSRFPKEGGGGERMGLIEEGKTHILFVSSYSCSYRRVERAEILTA
jgi:hypothetical protein